MKRSIVFFLLLAITSSAICQEAIIGVKKTYPFGIRAILEVNDIPDSGSTSAIFGGDRGISLQRDFAAVGFNQYADNTTAAKMSRYLGNGYAAVARFNHNALASMDEFSISIHAPGVANASLNAGKKVFCISPFGHVSLSGNYDAVLDVGRGSGESGTTVLYGTEFASHFNFSTAENTYIRAGRNGSSVFIADAGTGQVIFGGAGTRVGINSADPTYTFEIRQVANTGIKFIDAATNNSWEWRVRGSPTNFYALYNGVNKAAFEPVNGALLRLSDSRLKKNVHCMEPVMDKIMRLHPVTYENKLDNAKHSSTLGFIAQEVSELFPSIMNVNPGDKLQLLDYSAFGVLAVSGVQEQQVKINDIILKVELVNKWISRLEKGLENSK